MFRLFGNSYLIFFAKNNVGTIAKIFSLEKGHFWCIAMAWILLMMTYIDDTIISTIGIHNRNSNKIIFNLEEINIIRHKIVTLYSYV